MSKPGQPDRPEVSEAGSSSFRITWTIPQMEHEVSACTVKLRIRGSQRWQNYDHTTNRLVVKGGSTVPAPTCDVTVDGLLEGLEYEAIVAMMNSEGWGDVSEPSKSTHCGDLKPREKPLTPSAPTLTANGPNKMKCSWTIPDAFPPVEASQVQITEVATGVKLLVDAANGKLVSSGRTSLAATRLECKVEGVQDGKEYTAAICCRNAEGFSEYSNISDAAEIVPQGAVSGGNSIVLHESAKHEEPKPGGPPVMRPMSEARMKIRWSLPEDAKSTMVKLRRVGERNWYLPGGAAIPAPAAETIAPGLEPGLEYEAIISFLVNGRWSAESPVSKPYCIGDLKLPSTPDAPKEPRLIIADQAKRIMKLKWAPITTVPRLESVVIFWRVLGKKTWNHVNGVTGEIIENKDAEIVPVPASANEVDIVNLDTGVRYEAAIAFRNKLGQGPMSPPSDPVSIGRPKQNWMTCVFCGCDYDLQHAEYTKPADTFYCPPCRFRILDPFNACVEPHGLLMCHVLLRGTIAFSLDLPDLKMWRKENNDVYMRMVRIDSEGCAQVWPKALSLEANGVQVFEIKEPEEGHVRRDVPKNISSGLKPGVNTITIKIDDPHLPSFAMALVRTHTKTALQIAQETPHLEEEVARARFTALLMDTGSEENQGEEDLEITCVISNKLKLRCPLSFERVVIPVRGEQCQHLQCFGLGAYLESNMKMRALNNRWTCPVCGNRLKPHDLRVDDFVDKVLKETPQNCDEVEILEDGSYRLTNEEEPESPKKKEKKPKAADAPQPNGANTEEAKDAEMTDAGADGEAQGQKRPADADLPAAERRRRNKKLKVDDDNNNHDDAATETDKAPEDAATEAAAQPTQAA